MSVVAFLKSNEPHKNVLYRRHLVKSTNLYAMYKDICLCSRRIMLLSTPAPIVTYLNK
jgi:hypothetical protein